MPYSYSEVKETAQYLAQTKGGEVEDRLAEAARLLGSPDLDGMALALGGEISGDRWIRAPSPGFPADDRSLVIRLDHGGGYFIYAYDGPFARAKTHVEAIVGQHNPPLDPAERKAGALRIWDQTESLGGTPANAYLASRGLDPPPEADGVLRWHPACPWKGGTKPAMVALFRDVLTDEPVAIHRTSLVPKERWSLGPIARAAIKLWPAPAEGQLTIGEGIETVLAATKLWPELAPAWAMASANGIKALPVLPGVRRLTILIDHDEHGVGDAAARVCAARWNAAGLDVRRLRPKSIGDDFNDVLRKRI